MAHIIEPGVMHWDGNPAEVKSATVQCFPFYSILLAVNRTQVDFFSLDIEGHELKVIQTIPFHKVDVRVMPFSFIRLKSVKFKHFVYQTWTIEWERLPGGAPALVRLMESKEFTKEAQVSFPFAKDIIFINKKTL